MAGNTHTDGVGPLGTQQRFEQRLVTCIDVGFRAVRGSAPSVEFGVDELHREVGALDHSYLDPSAAISSSFARPAPEPAGGIVRIGQVRLQDDSGIDGDELRFRQHRHERRQREFEVAVLLHVEIHEGLGRRGDASPIQHTKSLADPFDRLIECEHVEIRDDRGDLHRHVVDVAAIDRAHERVQAGVSVGVGQDGLTERIDVESEPISGSSCDVFRECGIVGGQHDAAGLGFDAPNDQRHHQAGETWSHLGTDAQQESVERAHCSGGVPADGVGETLSLHAAIIDPHHLVGERQDQFSTVGIFEQRPETLSAASLDSRLVGQRGHQELASELDGLGGQLVVGTHLTIESDRGRCVLDEFDAQNSGFVPTGSAMMGR